MRLVFRLGILLSRGPGHVIWWGTLNPACLHLHVQHQGHSYNNDIGLPPVQSACLSVCLSVMQFPFDTISVQLLRL